MIDFNNVLITNKNLYIDVSIKDSPYFENCYIDRIVVNDINTFVTTGPNIEHCVYDTNDHSGDIGENAKSVKLFIKQNVLQVKTSKTEVSNNIYFVYIHTTGVPASDAPCGTDVEWHSIAVIDYQYLYGRALSLIRELTKCRCERPEKLVDFILRTKALEMFLISKEWDRAIEYFKKYYQTSDSCGKRISSSKNCGCCNG